jgi:acyl-coenzyme A synthetase/AMP-(fatty) acid ligase
MDADGRQIERGMELQSKDVNFAVIPFGHSYGLGNFLIPMLRSGMAVALGRSVLPRELRSDILTTSATVLPAVPAIIHALNVADLPADNLGPIRLVISAGGRLAAETARRFQERFGLAVHGFYGSTETGGITYDRVGEDTCTERSVGIPLPGVDVIPSRGGRLLVTSPAAFTHRNRRRSANGFGQVLLADLGRKLGDGSIRLIGRQRGFVKRAGRRVGLSEVEESVRTIAGVHEAWATVVRTGDGGEGIGLAIETDLPNREMRARIRDGLPKVQRPAKVICLRVFPSTPRGKIATAELQKLFDS